MIVMGAIQFSVLSWGYHVKLFKSLGGWGGELRSATVSSGSATRRVTMGGICGLKSLFFINEVAVRMFLV